MTEDTTTDLDRAKELTGRLRRQIREMPAHPDLVSRDPFRLR